MRRAAVRDAAAYSRTARSRFGKTLTKSSAEGCLWVYSESNFLLLFNWVSCVVVVDSKLTCSGREDLDSSWRGAALGRESEVRENESRKSQFVCLVLVAKRRSLPLPARQSGPKNHLPVSSQPKTCRLSPPHLLAISGGLLAGTGTPQRVGVSPLSHEGYRCLWVFPQQKATKKIGHGVRLLPEFFLLTAKPGPVSFALLNPSRPAKGWMSVT